MAAEPGPSDISSHLALPGSFVAGLARNGPRVAPGMGPKSCTATNETPPYIYILEFSAMLRMASILYGIIIKNRFKNNHNDGTMIENDWKNPKIAYKMNLLWVYVVSESLGIGCMAVFAAFPSTIMESTTVGRAPEAPAPLLWRRPKAASIMVDGKATNVTIHPIPADELTTHTHTQTRPFL